MILESLVRYYEILAAAGKLDRPGWSPVGVSYALELDERGALLQIVPLKLEQAQGKKTVLRPQMLNVPSPIKRTVAVLPNFLCDNSSYFLGVANKGKSERSRDCFLAAKTLHLKLLDGLSSPAAQALRGFFTTWQTERAAEHPLVTEVWDDLSKGANLVFWVGSGYAHGYPEIQAAWQRHYDNEQSEHIMQCLVTGKKISPARLHPNIKGVRGAQSGGAALVSFNAPSFESFGREQGEIAPVSSYVAFAYSAALNYLLSDRVQYIGDTAVVAWAEGGGEQYQNAFDAFSFGRKSETISEADLISTVRKLSSGEPVNWEGLPLNPENRFYVLGLAPNAARLSIRFFLQDSFGAFVKNTEEHNERLRIVRPAYDKSETLGLWSLLNETVNQNARDKVPSPQMAGDVLRAILTNTRYPATLYNGVQLRIRAEHEITRGRAAILKAYIHQNYREHPHYFILKEAAQVALNEQCTYQPYVLGRLFAIFESIQLASADWQLNRSIKDSYFNSAAATPRGVFAKLFPLSEYHMKKLFRDKHNLARKLNEEKRSLINLLEVDSSGHSIPTFFNSEERDAFYIGYHHQSNKEQEDKKNG